MLYGILIFCVCWLFVYIDNYCKNPYKLEAVVGSKGSGKSLYMSRVADKWLRANKGLIYSNMGIGYELEPEYWKQTFIPDSLILIDEIGVLHSNRDFKTMPREAVEFFKMQRKYHLTIIVSSQTMDFDKKIRDLCDRIYLCNRIGWFCRLTPYRSCIAMISTHAPFAGRDFLSFASVLFFSECSLERRSTDDFSRFLQISFRPFRFWRRSRHRRCCFPCRSRYL